ncbi:hypothetical protein Taro_046041 [Colocasia esculenta]|uniref:Uncharacterized protein n=1 Tax=Colocasia esculenta TaxID=4460 RepID=A0A843WSR7_COLES|nr:hypothetical protein [Colocasia esculenta]
MSKPQPSFPSYNRTPKHLGFLNTLHPNPRDEFRTCWGRVEELLVAEELWNDHKKLIFFPRSSATTCTNHPLEVDQSVPRGDTWLFLPDLVEVLDVGCLCSETLVSRGCSDVPWLLCLGGCVPRVCFRIVFDSAGSAGVVFGPTLVVVPTALDGKGLVIPTEPCSRGSPSYSLQRELRVVFLQVLGLFELIAYLTGLNSNPFGSSDPWVAVRPSGSLVGVREVGSLQELSNEISVSIKEKLGLSTPRRSHYVLEDKAQNIWTKDSVPNCTHDVFLDEIQSSSFLLVQPLEVRREEVRAEATTTEVVQEESIEPSLKHDPLDETINQVLRDLKGKRVAHKKMFQDLDQLSLLCMKSIIMSPHL